MATANSIKKPSSTIRLSAREVVLFTEELSTLLNAHLELDRALQLMRDSKQGESITSLLDLLYQRIHEGLDFSAALAEHPKTFSPTYINLVRAGEIGGNLADAVNRLSIYLDMMQGLRDRILSAVIYPMILLLVSAISLIVVVVFVLPAFEELFVDMGIVLPFITRAVMTFAHIFNQFWWLLFIVSLALFFYFKNRYRDPVVRVRVDSWLIRLPIIGAFIRDWETARFSRNLSVLTTQGVPLTQSLNVAADAVSNKAIAESLHVAAGDLGLGNTVSARLLGDNVLPRQASQMIKLGEETGELPEMLERVAILYDRKVRNGIDRGLALLEPVMVLMLATVIAVIIFSILLAILGLNDASF